MIFSLQQIVNLVLTYKYIILLPIAVVEGPIITIIGGFLASQGILNAELVYVIVVLGDLIGDTIYYAMGKFAGRSFIRRFGKYLGITLEREQRLEETIKKHTGKTLLFGKLTHVAGFALLIGAGMAEVPYDKYLWFNFLGTLPKSLILLLIGIYFGQAYEELNHDINYAGFIGIMLFIILFLLYYLTKLLKERLRKDGIG